MIFALGSTHNGNANGNVGRPFRCKGQLPQMEPDMHAALILTNATPDATRKYHLDQLPVTLGRGLDADIYVPDRLVSRCHCRLDDAEGPLMVADLDSSNGTLVNGCYVNEAPLLPGDHLIVGTHVFRVAYKRISLGPLPPTVYASPNRSSARESSARWP